MGVNPPARSPMSISTALRFGGLVEALAARCLQAFLCAVRALVEEPPLPFHPHSQEPLGDILSGTGDGEGGAQDAPR